MGEVGCGVQFGEAVLRHTRIPQTGGTQEELLLCCGQISPALPAKFHSRLQGTIMFFLFSIQRI